MFALPASVSAAGTVAALTKKAQAEIQKKHYDSAIILCNQAIQLDPKDPNLYLIRGTAKFDKADWDGAIADSSKAIELDPSNARLQSAMVPS